MAITFKLDTVGLKRKLARCQTAVDSARRDALDYFVSITPYKSGNARKKTRLQKETIVGDYPYAQRLDEGYSKQRPGGMTEPTGKYWEQRIKQLLKPEGK